MATKKTTSKATKKPAKTAAKKDFTKQQKQMAASVGPLLTIIGVLAIVTLFLGFYITLIRY
jgi:cobalamin biosynthesis Mg chelatase CobN